MTVEQWTNLKTDNVIQYQRNKYKLLFKDPVGQWITETLDFLDRPVNFRVLKIKEHQIRGFSLVSQL